MAEKGFGVKEINLIGPSGTPTIESPNNLNLNAVNVAISTNVSIGGTLSVSGNVSVGGTLTYEDVTNIDSVGVVTARNGVVVVGRGVSIAAGGLNVTAGISTLSGIVKIMSGLDIQTNGTLDIIGSSSSSGLDIQSNASVQIGQNGFPNNDYATFTNTGVNLNYNNSTKLATTNTGVTVTGTVAATAVTGDGSGLSNLPAPTPTATDVQVAYELINTSSSGNGWRINGNGIVNSTGNPDLYLIRGQKYRFINNSGGSHPFQIQSDSSTAYSTGVTNNNASSGNIDFVPRNDAPARLYYNCTNHGGMLGNIYLRGAGGQQTNVGVTTFTGAVRQTGNPVFMAYRTSNYSVTGSAAALVFNEEKIDVGNNYDTSNGRFTAPVTGLYEFAYASIASNTATVYRYDLRINGSIPYGGLRQELRIDQSGVTQYGTNGEFCLYINMTQGQYAQVYVHADANVSSVYGDTSYGYTYFRGRLIG